MVLLVTTNTKGQRTIRLRLALVGFLQEKKGIIHFRPEVGIDHSLREVSHSNTIWAGQINTNFLLSLSNGHSLIILILGVSLPAR